MQIGIVISLIVLAFVLPISAYFLYKLHLRRKARLVITAGELFDKECSRFEVMDEGKETELSVPNSTSLQKAIERLKEWLNATQKKDDLEAERFQRKAFKWEIMYIYNEKVLLPP